MRIPVTAAIVVELVTGRGIVGVHVPGTDIAVTVADDGGPGRPGRSPAGGRAVQLGQANQLGVAVGAVGRGGGHPVARPGVAVAGGRQDAGPPTAQAGGRAPELYRTGAAEQRAGHDGPTALGPGTMPGARGWVGSRATDGPAGNPLKTFWITGRRHHRILCQESLCQDHYLILSH